MMVYCVRCIDGSGFDMVHIFSTEEKAKAFAESDPRDHVLSDYVVDCPERAEQVQQ